MRDNSNDSNVQTISSMESSLQDLTPAMIKMGDSIDKLGQKIQKAGAILHDLFADMSSQLKVLARQHADIVAIMKMYLPQSSNQTVEPVESFFVPKQHDAHKPLAHTRVASNPLLLERNNQSEDSFHSTGTAAFQQVNDPNKEEEKLFITDIIDKMAEFREMWQSQGVSTEEKLKNKKKYSQQVNQAYLTNKKISKEDMQEILKIRMELTTLNYKHLIDSFKSNGRLINRQ